MNSNKTPTPLYAWSSPFASNEATHLVRRGEVTRVTLALVACSIVLPVDSSPHHILCAVVGASLAASFVLALLAVAVVRAVIRAVVLAIGIDLAHGLAVSILRDMSTRFCAGLSVEQLMQLSGSSLALLA